jgi:hypothetical protein
MKAFVILSIWDLRKSVSEPDDVKDTSSREGKS